MKVEVNVEKKYALMIIASVLILAGAIGIYAYTVNPGAVPNPGHTLTGIQGYFDGDADLQASLGKLCQKDGTNCNITGTGDGIGGAVQFYTGFTNQPRVIGVHEFCSLSKASWVGSGSGCACEVTGSKGGEWTLTSTRCESGGTIECSAVCINAP
ncbi:hypothetical protein CO038_01785 [Candidatus Pacearchaeota archaeon CG_4_9_14_0_2_um_filter_39_13]|nr:hypothetical protein [Candidatus Pacearchaeota archaeon]OIO43512.1 MAG: hypothetical protein AUJ64_02390 [Candidatus Pacearchaeota archaeon CG1_02_39_14]PJC44860.1 MAG: hypothetical protein CO038_01785 [Candidatus Pacearchaeota archaeon CG_4_9_14_0_2_um_filter_39_13]